MALASQSIQIPLRWPWFIIQCLAQAASPRRYHTVGRYILRVYLRPLRSKLDTCRTGHSCDCRRSVDRIPNSTSTSYRLVSRYTFPTVAHVSQEKLLTERGRECPYWSSLHPKKMSSRTTRLTTIPMAAMMFPLTTETISPTRSSINNTTMISAAHL